MDNMENKMTQARWMRPWLRIKYPKEFPERKCVEKKCLERDSRASGDVNVCVEKKKNEKIFLKKK